MKHTMIRTISIMMMIFIMAGMTAPSPAWAGYSTKEADVCAKKSCNHKKKSGSSYCTYHTCAEPGCTRGVSSANDRCSVHKPIYYQSLGISTASHPITTCNVSGCCKTRATGSSYCKQHTCAYKSCKCRTISQSSYCSSHTCEYPGCFKEVNSANQRCAAHKNAAYPSSGTTGMRSESSYSTSSSKKKNQDKDVYHASAYSNYEDFYEDHYDDFDGIDDAEDYWDAHH